MLKASLAVTVKFWEVPAVALGKPESVRLLAVAALTKSPVWEPLMLLPLSVAVMLWVVPGTVLSVPLKVWTPASPPANL